MLKFTHLRGKLYHLVSKQRSLVLLSTIGCGIATSLLCTALPAQTTQPSTTATDAEMGWEFLGSRDLNQTEVTEIEYHGNCPGKDTPSTEAKFTSSKTPPAPGRRVTVRNVTRGLASDPYPYTDREYDKGRSSESTQMIFGTRHNGKHLIVLQGENSFEYDIRQGNQVIDSGTFTATINLNQDARERKAILSTNKVCMNSQVALNLCADIRNRMELKCPDGKVIESKLEPNISEISTLIANQSSKSMTFTLNGQIERLSPGESRMVTGTSLSLSFLPCQSCGQLRTMSLQPGKRYQFKKSLYIGGQIDLGDYPNTSL
ncbi:MAG: hypothetical protein KME27_28060 [Lyngbya sp. HA4199-MV5]|jgi:hypothetical protein|nr:hypothetical protein [Lyngbya sp. HA4199-MV5]